MLEENKRGIAVEAHASDLKPGDSVVIERRRNALRSNWDITTVLTISPEKGIITCESGDKFQADGWGYGESKLKIRLWQAQPETLASIFHDRRIEYINQVSWGKLDPRILASIVSALVVNDTAREYLGL